VTIAQQSLLVVERARYLYPGRAALSFPDCALAEGEAVALIGPSGSGKTTLLMLLAGLLTAQEGRIEVAGTLPGRVRGAARDRWRGRTIGMVLQSFQLLAHLSVLENLQAAQYFAGAGTDSQAALATLAALGIADLAHMRPGRLSRGQAQRAAIARAMVNRPKLVLADEPTSSLDDESAAASLRLLLDESRTRGASLLIATHDRRVTSLLPRCIALRQAVPA